MRKFFSYRSQALPGMSLLQCCIVIALISFVSALSVNFLATQSKSLVRFELEKLYAAVLFLQRKASMTGVEQKIYIDTDKRCYSVEGKIQTFASGVTYGYLPTMWGPPAHPVYQIDKSVTFKDATIVCYPDGTVSAGAVYVKDTRSRYFYSVTSGISPAVYLRMYWYDTKAKNWRSIERNRVHENKAK